MSKDELIDSFVKGEPLAVPVDAIDKELVELWQSVAHKKLDLTRVCQFNLLVYSPNEGAYERAAHALTELMHHHPCRAIVLIAEPEAEKNEISAFISVSGISSDNPIRGEQITVIAKGHAVERLPEVAAALIVGNLPAVLWWQGDLLEENIVFNKLLAASQHLIFDSADGYDTGSTLSRASALNLHLEKGIYGDLNWLRLSLWRELMAAWLKSPSTAFNSEQVVEIAIEVAAAPEGDAHFAQPLLLLGWLADQLNWKLHEPLTSDKTTAGGSSVFRTSWQNENQEVIGRITLRKLDAESEEMAAGGIISAQIHLRQNSEPLIFSVQRHTDNVPAGIQVTQGEQVISESTSDFFQMSTADLLAHEIDRAAGDQNYEIALRLATQLI